MHTFMALFVLTTTPAMAANEVLSTSAEWLARMSDFSQNTLPARDPKAFLGLLNAITEPSLHRTRIDKVTEPQLWKQIIRTATSEGAVTNLQSLLTPQIPINWMAAMTNPQFYEAAATILTDPGKQMRWMMAAMDPDYYGTFGKFASPALYARWGQSAVSPLTARDETNIRPVEAEPVRLLPMLDSPIPFLMNLK